MTIKDLKIKRMKTKNAVEKSTLMMLIDFTEKFAKEKQGNVDDFLIPAIKKYQKQLGETVNPNQEEVEIVAKLADEVLPKTLNEEDTKQVIAEILHNCEEVTKKCFGVVMGKLKKRDDVEMKIASKLLKEILG